MSQIRSSILISSVGVINLVVGLAYVAFGVYVLAAGADAVASLFQIQKDASQAVGQAPIVADANAQKFDDVTKSFAKGLSGIILAMAGVLGGCVIAQGLPLVLVGVGLLLRSNAARIFAIVFALLALLEGLACVASTGQSNRFLIGGIVLLTYAILSFVALFGKRASFEFSGGLKRAADPSMKPSESQAMNADVSAPAPTPTSPKQNVPAVTIVMAALLAATSAATAVFATLYFTQKPAPPAAVQIDLPRIGFAPDTKAAPIDDTTTLAQHKPKLAAFHDAVLAGQIPRAASLLKDVDIDEPDEQGRTALMKAASNGSLRMAMFLLGMGAQLNQVDKAGRTPLMYAVEKDQVTVIEIFLGRATAPNEMAAFRAQYKEPSKNGLNVKELLGGTFTLAPQNANARDNTGRNAYMQAVLKGHFKAAETIFGNGGAEWTDAKGDSLLHILVAAGDWKTIRLIDAPVASNPWANTWRYGNRYALACCDAKQINGAGQEAWMLAAEKAPLEIVKHLLSEPTLADLKRKDIAGKTGLDLAAANQHKEVAAYLTQLEADLTRKAEEEKAKKSKEDPKKK